MEHYAYEQDRPSSSPDAGRQFSDQVAAASGGAAAADQAHLVAALDEFNWERRGFLRTLARRRRLRSALR